MEHTPRYVERPATSVTQQMGFLRIRRISDDVAVAKGDPAPGISSHIRLVGDHDDGDALLVEGRKKRHDLFAGGAVQIAGR